MPEDVEKAVLNIGTIAKLSFRPIDPNHDNKILISYCRDLISVNFGTDARFVDQFGADGAGYVALIRGKLMDDPESALFACTDSAVVGMVVIGRWRADPSVGYVYHYYLAPSWRGRGLGAQLDDQAIKLFLTRGFRRVRLSAATANSVALRFYKNLGWIDAGARGDVPGVQFLEKTIPEP
jgi:GNAT superfamily N-acetyltransferase